ncbi:MAG: hypothetical protein M3258_07535 [Thermoproteota archaeon]|jgi:hypothetical protein|nr:hypothetical protein [Thermoproteota archaeon]
MMFGTHPGRIPFESHLEKLKEPARTILVDLRKFVVSLGNNVIEDIRPHRIVYSKTLNFRTFLDIQPIGDDSLTLSIRYDRHTLPITVIVMTMEDADRAKKQIGEAYQKIH